MRIETLISSDRIAPDVPQTMRRRKRKDGFGTIIEGDYRQMIGEVQNAVRAHNTFWTGGPQDWTGVRRNQDALSFGLYGWHGAAEEAKRMFRSAQTVRVTSMLPRIVWCEDDGEPDCGLYLDGSDTPYQSIGEDTRITMGTGTVCTVVHNIFCSGGDSIENHVKRGVAAAALAWLLTAAGLRVQCIARMAATCGSDYRITINKAGQPIFLPRLLYWWSHPSVIRVMLHTVKRRGFSADFNRPDLPHSIETDGFVVHQDMNQWLRKTLTGIGIQVRG